MPVVTLTPADLEPFATIDVVKAQAMIDDALALAAAIAPCISSETFAFDAAAKAIIRRAILRWNEAGSGALQTVTTGPFGSTIDTRQKPSWSIFSPSEIDELRSLCPVSGSGAFSIDTLSTTGNHADWCSLYFGALYCSCGADLTNYAYPLYEETW